MSHYVLGFTDGLAPMGAWVAIKGSLFSADDAPAWLLLGAVTLWIGGFDVIYACQDVTFDQEHGLFSIPACFGIGSGLQIARISHAVTMLVLVALGVLIGLAWPYWLGLVLIAGLLTYEHSLVKSDDLSKLNVAFFNINGYISLTLFAGIIAAVLVG